MNYQRLRFDPCTVGVRVVPVECFEMMCLFNKLTLAKDSMHIVQLYAPPVLETLGLLDGATVRGNGGRRGRAPPTC